MTDTPAPGGSPFPAGNADPGAQPLSAEEEAELRRTSASPPLGKVLRAADAALLFRRLLATLDAARVGTCAAGRGCPMAQAIDAIEAEARAEGYAAGLAAARRAVAELPYAPMRYSYIGDPVEHRLDHMERDTALAAIDALSGSSSPHADADLAVDP